MEHNKIFEVIKKVIVNLIILVLSIIAMQRFLCENLYRRK